nr:bifunctional DNA-formamidopyrimidine glycosylase/DNA-(apurinic or apyrimidinic site) lyase [Halorhodospira abdelmalekii]
MPEVETTRRGLEPFVRGRFLCGANVYQPQLRYPVPADLHERVAGRCVIALRRRGKYLIFELSDAAWVTVHLGMSGSLRLLDPACPPARHDHIDLLIGQGAVEAPAVQPVWRVLRLHDPRRFGSLLAGEGVAEEHRLLRELGVEPLSEAFTGDYLYRCARARRISVKALLMDARVVVGIGNIYANEALYRAGIRPDRSASRISAARYRRLVAAVRSVLEAALAVGGTTLRDFIDSSGRRGYFTPQLAVYGGGTCPACGRALTAVRIAQRSTWFCRACQR